LDRTLLANLSDSKSDLSYSGRNSEGTWAYSGGEENLADSGGEELRPLSFAQIEGVGRCPEMEEIEEENRTQTMEKCKIEESKDYSYCGKDCSKTRFVSLKHRLDVLVYLHRFCLSLPSRSTIRHALTSS